MGWDAAPCWGLAECTGGQQTPYLSPKELLSSVVHLTLAIVEPQFVDIGRVGFLRVSLTPRAADWWRWRETQTVAEGRD